MLYLQSALLAESAPPASADSSVTMDANSELFAAPTRIDQIGRVVAPVTVNDAGPFRFVVDTGAGYSTISPRLASTLGLSPADAFPIVVNGITGTTQVPSVMIQRLEAGELAVENIRLPVVWAPVMGGADGILGVAGLQRERLLVDFEHNRVSVTHSFGESGLSGYTRIRAKRLAGGLIAVPVRVGRVRAQAIIDTGSERTLGNFALQHALRAGRQPGAPALRTSVYGATTDVSVGEVAAAPPIYLGDVTISRVGIVYGDFHIFDVWDLTEEPAIILGMDVLGTLRSLAIDFRRGILYLLV